MVENEFKIGDEVEAEIYNEKDHIGVITYKYNEKTWGIDFGKHVSFGHAGNGSKGLNYSGFYNVKKEHILKIDNKLKKLMEKLIKNG